MGWWAQRLVDRRRTELIPVPLRPLSWVVDRPDEVERIVVALQDEGTVGVTTAVHGAGGFGETTVARLVQADLRVLDRFDGRVYWVTLGRDARTSAGIAAKVNDLLTRLDPTTTTTFTDSRVAAPVPSSRNTCRSDCARAEGR
ncbi:NB-ARC domain-containing protein [Saccharothrix xinjiangensis]|uniref:NB-ARC domain-containing protein n=1 Tax=Saccharothrix xinjiangensis TaxID=204798 RepID=A0ABV9XYC1_9PSEU